MVIGLGYEPPVGKELRIAKLVDREVVKLRKDSHNNGPTIFTDHTIEGVRCNGYEQLNTVPRDLKKLGEYLNNRSRELKSLSDHVVKVRQAVSRLEKAFAKVLTVCSSCRGEGGFGSNGSSADPWNDCYKCGGRGCILK